jgi:hypothetical protein
VHFLGCDLAQLDKGVALRLEVESGTGGLVDLGGMPSHNFGAGVQEHLTRPGIRES